MVCVCVDECLTLIQTHTRVKNKSALLKGECRHYHWQYLDTAWSIGHYCSNLQPPLRLPHDIGNLDNLYAEVKDFKAYE